MRTGWASGRWAASTACPSTGVVAGATDAARCRCQLRRRQVQRHGRIRQIRRLRWSGGDVWFEVGGAVARLSRPFIGEIFEEREVAPSVAKGNRRRIGQIEQRGSLNTRSSLTILPTRWESLSKLQNGLTRRKAGCAQDRHLEPLGETEERSRRAGSALFGNFDQRDTKPAGTEVLMR